MLRFISFAYTTVLRLFGINIKKNVRIWPFVYIAKGFGNGRKGRVTIDEYCEISQGTVLKAYGGEINIAQNTFLGEYVIIYGHGGVDSGQQTLIAMHTFIVSSNHTVPDQKPLIRSQADIRLPVKIGN